MTGKVGDSLVMEPRGPKRLALHRRASIRLNTRRLARSVVYRVLKLISYLLARHVTHLSYSSRTSTPLST